MPTLAELLANLSEQSKNPDRGGQSFADAIADPLSKPFGWQTQAPDDVFGRGDPVGESLDLDRILALPRREPLDLTSVTAEAMVELEMQKYAIDNPNCKCREIDPRKGCIKRLLPAQAWMLREISLNQGLLAHASVGIGKTLINILAALALSDVKRVLLLIPSSLVEQLQYDYLLIKEHFRVPALWMHLGDKRPIIDQLPIPGVPDVHVLPYSRLSLPSESNFIPELDPDAIIADECDSVRSMSASRGIRLAKWFSGGETPEERRRRQSTKFLGWTGSLTDHSICEFNWLSLFALKERSPLPLDPQTVEEWGRCLDATNNPSPPGELLRFCNDGEDVRHAFRRRLSETSGFIIANQTRIEVAGGQGEEVKIEIREKEAPALPPIIEEALKMVRSGVRPDMLIPTVRPELEGQIYGNDELEDALAIARAAQEVSVGVLYFWTYPRGEPVPLIKEWLKRKSAYFCAVRDQSQQGVTYLDSAMLCEHAAMRFYEQMPKRPDRPEWECYEWPAWYEIRDQVQPKTESCVLHDFIAQDAIEWAAERPGIIWYTMRALATKMQELSGLPVHDGGPGAEKRLRAETGKRSIICSIRSNGRGRDGLQLVFDRNAVLNPPASATGWEQLLGRGHRRGQKSGVVSTEIYMHTPELRKAVKQAATRSKYVKDILGADQKLLLGWNEFDNEED
jgi:hypothetical protein